MNLQELINFLTSNDRVTALKLLLHREVCLLRYKIRNNIIDVKLKYDNVSSTVALSDFLEMENEKKNKYIQEMFGESWTIDEIGSVFSISIDDVTTAILTFEKE